MDMMETEYKVHWWEVLFQGTINFEEKLIFSSFM